MTEDRKFDGRRALLKKAAGISAALAAAGMVAARTAEAAGMTKASVKYQDKPKGGHQCDGCALFVPGSSATANGTCKAVAGSISPKGWCTLWTPKAA
ncbi:high-potential iron-sulfur protein [Acidiphilium sp. AL]|uniref:High-potential iron-sulfur protein n=1 Tax=Acidiphilium iwatense TaxID=768198 RepID=A0ABS9DUB4_9PROT|nr:MULTISPECIES: high-potential iron-sulfur protein [Acidiphilium]MCF3946318.1 high-potential iron-sulfur protein [Acidiphilium iwatense]MCU4159898.1 high-potential iron-sulfur protein [Acidiphilium sp. AL]